MTDETIPRRKFLLGAGLAGTAVATGKEIHRLTLPGLFGAAVIQIAPGNDAMPPIAAATNPEIVNSRPVSNCSEVVGATMTPEIAAISVARPKLNSVIRGTSMPIRLAAAGFSAQARKALPSLVLAMRNQSAAMHAAVAPNTQNACVGIRMVPNASGRSPENGGIA